MSGERFIAINSDVAEADVVSQQMEWSSTDTITQIAEIGGAVDDHESPWQEPRIWNASPGGTP